MKKPLTPRMLATIRTKLDALLNLVEPYDVTLSIKLNLPTDSPIDLRSAIPKAILKMPARRARG